MKQFAEYNEEEQLDESWKNLATGFLVLKIRGISKKIKIIRYRRSNTDEENIENLFTKIDLLAEQANSIGYLSGQIGVMKDAK